MPAGKILKSSLSPFKPEQFSSIYGYKSGGLLNTLGHPRPHLRTPFVTQGSSLHLYRHLSEAELELIHAINSHEEAKGTVSGAPKCQHWGFCTWKNIVTNVVDGYCATLEKNINSTLDIKILTQAFLVLSEREAGMIYQANPRKHCRFSCFSLDQYGEIYGSYIHTVCGQAQHLQKVFTKKRDTISHICLIEGKEELRLQINIEMGRLF